MRQRATTSTIHTFSPQRSYRYGYDSLSRLTRARYSDSEGGAGRYDTRYSYDLNGNVTSLVRRGVLSLSSAGLPSAYGAIDSLTLEYAGNRLRSVSDAAAGPHYQGAFHFTDGADEDEEYRYDFNGNTVTDLNRGILSGRFDTAGHPARMDFADGSSTSYLYDDAGTKLRTLHRVASVPVAVPGSQGPALTETVTDYCAGFVYEDSLLTRINLDGAYLSYTGADGSRLSTPEYHFYLRDHLGNNRVDVAADGRICQVTDYYPYGLPMASSRNAAAQRWLFGGKELDRISGLDLYDFEARAYDPALARFTSHDAFEEKYPSLTPYLYCAANPLRLIDPTGKDIYNVDINGKFSLVNRTSDTYDRIVSPIMGAGTSIDVEKSFLSSQENVSGKTEAKSHAETMDVTVSIYNTTGGNEAVYDFLIDNTDVEWSHFETKNSNGERVDYIGTTNEPSIDASQDVILGKALNLKLDVKTVKHNHSLGNEVVSSGDVEMAKKIQSHYPNAELFIVFPKKLAAPIKYDKSTPPAQLREVVVNGKLPEKKK